MLLERTTLVEPGEQQEVVDEHPHADGLFFDPAHRLGEVLGPLIGAAAEQLGVAADRRQRRAQLVRRVGRELPQACFGRGALGERAFDLVEHAVQGEAEPADFGRARGGFDALREVASRDRVGGAAHAFERAESEPDEPPTERGERAEHRGCDHELDEHEPAQRLADIVERERDHEGVAIGEPGRCDAEVRAPGRRVDGECAAGERDRQVGWCGVDEERVVTADNGAVRGAHLVVTAGGEHDCARAGGRSCEHRIELRVDPVDEEQAQRAEGREAGDDESDRGESDEAERQPGAQRHAQSSGGSRRL